MRIARFTVQALKPTDRAPLPHPAQGLPLFEDVSPFPSKRADGDGEENAVETLARKLMSRH